MRGGTVKRSQPLRSLVNLVNVKGTTAAPKSRPRSSADREWKTTKGIAKMKTLKEKPRNYLAVTSIAACAFAILTGATAWAQCPVTELVSGLQAPLGMTFSNKTNLIVAESGTATPNSGRI